MNCMGSDNITHTNMLFYTLHYDIISLTSLKITKAFHLLLDFAEIQGVFWDFKIQNSVRITKGSENGDSDNQGSIVSKDQALQIIYLTHHVHETS